MKLLTTLADLTKIVEYHGLKLQIPADHYYLATDRNGDVCSYGCEPAFNSVMWFCREGDYNAICRVDLEGLDWQKTLVSFKEGLKDNAAK